jgi:hypothetical protein
MDWYSASDHLYLLHEFVNNRKKKVQGNFMYSTKNVDVGRFLSKFDEHLDIMVNGE